MSARVRRARALAVLQLALLTSVLATARAACAPAAGLTPIAAIQGTGERSPLLGRELHVQGVVTASFPGSSGLGGFFLQDPKGDGDPATSDALFVRFGGRAADAPGAGDVVRVAGTVAEVRGMTEIEAVTALERCGSSALPAPENVELPLPPASGWEALEGMLVRLPATLTVTGVYDLPRYGELTLAAGRLFAASQGAPAPALGGGTVVLDDGSARRDPRPLPYRLAGGRPPRVGDEVRGLTAVVMEGPVGYELEPVTPPSLLPTNPRPAAAPAVGGDLTVATFNVHNLFTSLHQRGASTASERSLQRRQVATVLAGLNADVVALQEVENDGMRTEDALLAALDAQAGGTGYAAVPDPAAGVGGDRIKQAILYRPGRLELLSTASDPSPVFERAPVAATFRSAGGAVLTVIAVHLKAKSGCPTAGDVDKGYGCWNLRRTAQAQAVLDFATRLERSTGSPDVVVAGDLNSYAAEPPLRLFAAAGYRSADRLVPPEQRYSYVYMGRSGTLDYLLASPALASRWIDAAFWHIDADEPPLPAAAEAPTVFRASDHDPLLAGIRWGAGR